MVSGHVGHAGSTKSIPAHWTIALKLPKRHRIVLADARSTLGLRSLLDQCSRSIPISDTPISSRPVVFPASPTRISQGDMR